MTHSHAGSFDLSYFMLSSKVIIFLQCDVVEKADFHSFGDK